MYLIEFIGLPGSGKTTITNELFEKEKIRSSCMDYANLLPLDRSKLFYRVRHILKVIWFCLGNRKLSVVVYAILCGSSLQRKRAAKYLDISARVWGHRHRACIAILDQGPFQALWSLVMCGGVTDNQLVANLVLNINRSCLPDVLCFCNVAPEKAADRLLARRGGETEFDRLSRSEIIEKYQLGQRVYQVLIDTAKSAQIPVIEMSSDVNPCANANRIMAFIDKPLRVVPCVYV